MKQCSRCQEEKPDSAFHFRNREQNVRFNTCKMCVKEQQRQYRQRNPEQRRDTNLRYYDANRERRNKAARRSQSTPEAKEKAKEWRRRNAEKMREYQKDYRDRTRWARMEKQYGITMADYARLVDDQNGKCPICQAPLETVAIHIDHCHTSGRVRGLLCPTCNQALGLLREDVHIAARAVAYLRGAYLG